MRFSGFFNGRFTTRGETRYGKEQFYPVPTTGVSFADKIDGKPNFFFTMTRARQ